MDITTFLLVLGLLLLASVILWLGPTILMRWHQVVEAETDLRIKRMKANADYANSMSEAQKRLYRFTFGSFPAGNYGESLVDPVTGRVYIFKPDPGSMYPALQTLHETKTHTDNRQLPVGSGVSIEVSSGLPDRVDFLEGFARHKKLLSVASQMPLLYCGESATEPIIVPLRDVYHLGWAGPTRSGKSSAIDTVIANLVIQGIAVILAFIDPLQKETPRYASMAQAVPELFGDSPEKAQKTMRLVYNEILRRLKLPTEERTAQPHLLVIIDELYFVSGLFDAELNNMLEKSYSLGAGANVYFLAGCQDMSMKTVPRMVALNTRSRFAAPGIPQQQLTALGLNARLVNGVERKKGRFLYSFPEAGDLKEQSGIMQSAYIDETGIRSLLDRSPAPPQMSWAETTTRNVAVTEKDISPQEKAAQVYQSDMSIRELMTAANINNYQARSYINSIGGKVSE